MVDAGDDREKAIERAVELINEQDTIVFLSKVVSRIGQFKITKDQLILQRKSE